MSQAQPAYLWVKSNKQGVIKGFTNQEKGGLVTDQFWGEEDTSEMILVNMADNTLIRNIQQETGQTQGKTSYGEVSCTCSLDKSTAYLFKALLEGDECSVKLYFFHEGKKALKDGAVIGEYTGLRNWFTISLEKARVINVSLSVGPGSDTVNLGFSYKLITYVNHDNDNKLCTYDWANPRRS